MTTHLSTTAPPGNRLTFTFALAVFAFLAVFLGAYVAGYFWLGNREEWAHGLDDEVVIERTYPLPIFATLYTPAGWLEARSLGVEVVISWGPAPPIQYPPTPAPIVHLVDWRWVPEGEHGDGDYAEFLDIVERAQQQQMQEIRKLGVREVWMEGQSDETIADFRARVEKLKNTELPTGDSPEDQLLRDARRQDLLQLGAAGRMLLAGEIDIVVPLEDHEAWTAAQPVEDVIDIQAKAAREQAMANRLVPGAVIVLGAEHDLRVYFRGDVEVKVIRVDALPREARP